MSQKAITRAPTSPRWVVLLLILTAFGLALTSMRVKSATFDEDAYIGRGTAIWMEGNYWLRTAHPALAPMLSTLPLLTERGLTPPTDHQCWPDGTGRSCGRELLFFRNDTRRVLFLARLPTIFLLLILVALVYRLAGDLFGAVAGLLAAALCAFDPNLTAHARLVTLDLASTFFVFVSCLAFYRFWSRPGWSRMVLVGLALGAAGATRFTTGFLPPLFAILSLVRVWKPTTVGGIPLLKAPSRWRRVLLLFLLVLVIGFVAAVFIWVVYGAGFGPVPHWGGLEMPMPAYFDDLAALLEYRDRPQDAFLLGRNYEGGWWLFFPVALLVKTPLPTILLITLAVVDLVRRRDGGFADVLLLAVATGYLVLSLFSPFNIGYRHLLPMLPPLFVFAGRAVRALRTDRGRWLERVPVLLVAWLICANLLIHPHYLAYFNELVAPRNGYKVLVDSSLDWGQDLPALEQYVEDEEISQLYLSWFGESRPWQYDIPYRFIPSKPDELSDVFTRVYHPDYPLPGVYAISATNLQGVLFDDKDVFSWFLQREPVAQPGYSVLVYRVPRLLDAEAPSVTVMLGGPQFDQVDPAAFENLWRTNDLRLGWFAPATSCQIPAHGDVWFVIDVVVEPDSLLCPFIGDAEFAARLPVRGGEGQLSFYHLYVGVEAVDDWMEALAADSPLVVSDETSFVLGEAPDSRREVAPPLRFAQRVELLGYRVLTDVPRAASEWQLVTYWRSLAGDADSLAVFVQLLDDSGNPRAGSDGLDVPTIMWSPGDVIVQSHTLSLPPDLQAGRYWVQFGVYRVQGVSRLPVLLDGEQVGDRVLLPSMEVSDGE